MSSRITRRQLTSLLGAIPLAGQNTTPVPPQGSPAPAPAAATPEQKMKKADDDVRKASAQLASIEVPMSVEPAFSFSANRE